MRQLFHTASLDTASWLMILTLRLAKFLAVEANGLGDALGSKAVNVALILALALLASGIQSPRDSVAGAGRSAQAGSAILLFNKGGKLMFSIYCITGQATRRIKSDKLPGLAA